MSDKTNPAEQQPSELTDAQLDDVGGGAAAAPKPVKPKPTAPGNNVAIETEDGTVIWVG